VFCDAAIIKAQLLHVLKSFCQLVVQLECFLESLNKLFVISLTWLVCLHIYAFFNLCLNKLLFPYSSVSICQIGQNEGNLLLVVIINQFVHFEVNKNILHEEDEVASFPCKGFWWIKLDILRGFCCHRGCNGFGHGFFLLSVLVSVSSLDAEVSEVIKVSSIVESKFRGISLSWCRGVGVCCKNTGAFVGESTLLLDFKTFKQNV
jgi:hypothetical protein